MSTLATSNTLQTCAGCTQALATSLRTRKVADLKDIATNCGVLTGGTKAVLVDRLTAHLASPTQSSSILSFDLGYRNLAYCHLSANKTVLDWARVDLDLPSFHPSVVAPIVRKFIKDKVLQNLEVVDRVLVEQQRARTGGSSNVFEHTLRVNCVEAVLWCGLFEGIEMTKRNTVKMNPTLRHCIDRVWRDDLQAVMAEAPQKFTKIKVGQYQKKQAGAMLVQKWLDTDTVVTCPDHFKEMYALEKKKDDLSDCLQVILATATS
ncbi:ribonuclease H-like domain-containing protein [Parasitella parasitica]|nr:ribonuclease H-like domain-containing protein [Parasitella parasitica]